MEANALAPRSLETAFYTVADSRYFPGAVAMINSLRLLGHTEEILALDCGLEEREQALLSSEATVVPGRRDILPHLQKLDLPLARPAEVMVLVDADVIFTRPLDELIAAAASGRLVAFIDRAPHRHFPEWSELLGLGEVVRGPYLNSGILFVPKLLRSEILEAAAARMDRIEVSRSMLGGGPERYPFSYLDQDAVNAVAWSLGPPGPALALATRLAPPPPFPGVRIVDEASIRCTYQDGTEPYALHHLDEKPWLAATATSPYTRLFTRLTLGPDVPLRLPPGRLPLRLRAGSTAELARRASGAQASARARWRALRLAVHAARVADA